MKYLLFIALGGAGGAVARYLLATWVHQLWEGRWPIGTLLVNMAGSFAIGIVFVLIERQVLHPDWRAVLMVGFLGALTTFSTFSLETLTLIEEGELVRAFANTLASVVVCVAAAWAGVLLARSI